MLKIGLKPTVRIGHQIHARLVVQMDLLGKSYTELASEIEIAETANPALEREPDDFDLSGVSAYLRSPSGISHAPELPGNDFHEVDFLTKPIKLPEYLERQIGEMRTSEAIRAACEVIVNELTDDGYLPRPVEELAIENGHPVDAMQAAKAIIQGLDPAGVGAADLRECLMLQLKRRSKEDSLAYRILDQLFGQLIENDVAGIAMSLGISAQAVTEAQSLIRKLDPHPGLRFNVSFVGSAIPEVRIELRGGRYVVTSIDERFPRLRISTVYLRMVDNASLDSQARSYLRERISSAAELLRSLHKRKKTIIQVCEAIVRRQEKFFEGGRLSPMLMVDVAAELGIHPATVSRAVAGKFAETPRGIVALRGLFSTTGSSRSADVAPKNNQAPKTSVRRRLEARRYHVAS